MPKKIGGKSTKGAKSTSTTSKSRAAADGTTYALGPQTDGAIVVRIENDFDLMVLRKACEKQKKNATAATGTVSALAEGEDPFIDAVERSLDRLLSAVNRARAPENQIKGTPIGDAINSSSADASESSDEADLRDARGLTQQDVDDTAEVHHGGTRRWANAIPRPRPKAGDRVEFPDGTRLEVVDALGFRGDGLTGSESSDELQKLADDGKLTGVFELIVKDRSENVFVKQSPLHHDSRVTFETWRVPGHETDYDLLDSRDVATAGNVGTSVTDVVEQSAASKSGTAKRSVSPAPKPSSKKKRK